jgi:hypothetical protein
MRYKKEEVSANSNLSIEREEKCEYDLVFK